MDKYKKHNYTSQNPSFSSTLLDQIYRSIDEQYIHTSVETKEQASFQRIEKWMEEKKARENIINIREKSSASLYTHRPRPIRTEKASHEEKRKHKSDSVVKRSKLKALKIYGDLKNAKQPISPGAKVASFLNSLFSARENVKKGKTSGANSSNTSPACSASRSCLSKASSTREKLVDSGAKKSVRFYPVNVEERTRELFRNYAGRVESEGDEDEDEDEGDDASYASSDLFELESLNNCGVNVRGNYMEELPVYETTYLHNLLAVAD